MGDSVDKNVPLTYPDMRCLAEHAASCFPDREFFLCADEEMSYVRGSELYGFCKKAAAALDKIAAEGHVALLGPGSAAWLAAYFAVLSAGRVIVPLHDGMQLQELEEESAQCATDYQKLMEIEEQKENLNSALMDLYEKGRITKDTLLTSCNNFEFMVKRVGSR